MFLAAAGAGANATEYRSKSTRSIARGVRVAGQNTTRAIAQAPAGHRRDTQNSLAGAPDSARRTGKIDIALASGNGQDWDLAAADLLVHEAKGC